MEAEASQLSWNFREGRSATTKKKCCSDEDEMLVRSDCGDSGCTQHRSTVFLLAPMGEDVRRGAGERDGPRLLSFWRKPTPALNYVSNVIPLLTFFEIK